MSGDEFAATRCPHCGYAKHICDLLRMQGEFCCPQCDHTEKKSAADRVERHPPAVR